MLGRQCWQNPWLNLVVLHGHSVFCILGQAKFDFSNPLCTCACWLPNLRYATPMHKYVKGFAGVIVFPGPSCHDCLVFAQDPPQIRLSRAAPETAKTSCRRAGSWKSRETKDSKTGPPAPLSATLTYHGAKLARIGKAKSQGTTGSSKGVSVSLEITFARCSVPSACNWGKMLALQHDAQVKASVGKPPSHPQGKHLLLARRKVFNGTDQLALPGREMRTKRSLTSSKGCFCSACFRSSGVRSGCFCSGCFRSGGVRSGCFCSGCFRSGGVRSGCVCSGCFRSGGVRSGCFCSGCFRSGGVRSGCFCSGCFRSGGVRSGCVCSGCVCSACFRSGCAFVSINSLARDLRSSMSSKESGARLKREGVEAF